MSVRMYRLEAGGEPVFERDWIAWGPWYEHADRQLARTQVGEADVSTVFMGYDMRPGADGTKPPILWETRIMGGPLDQWSDCYSTRAEAQAGHEAAVAMLRPPDGKPP